MARPGLPRTVGPVLLAAAFAPLLLVLGSVTAPHSEAKAPIHRPAPGPVPGMDVAATIQRTIEAAHTVTVTPLDPGPAQIPWPAFVEYSFRSVAFSISADGAVLPAMPTGSVRYFDPRFQMYVPGRGCVATVRDQFTLPWICFSDTATDDLAESTHATLPFNLGHYNPYSIVRVLQRASSVTVVAPKPQDGPTIHYHAVLDGDDFIPLVVPTSNKELAALTKGDLEQVVDLLVSADGHPVQLTVGVPGLSIVRVQTYSKWGAAGHVMLPGKSYVIDSSDLEQAAGQSGQTA